MKNFKIITAVTIVFILGIICLAIDSTNSSSQKNTVSQLSNVTNSTEKELSQGPSTGVSELYYFTEKYNSFYASNNYSPITPENTPNYDLLHSWHGIYASSSSEDRYQYVGIQFYYNKDNELKLKVSCRYYGNFDPYYGIIHNPKDISYNKIDDLLSRDSEQSIILSGTTYKRIDL